MNLMRLKNKQTNKQKQKILFDINEEVWVFFFSKTHKRDVFFKKNNIIPMFNS